MSEPTRLDGDLHVRGNLIVDGKGGLPEVTEADNGMVLGVEDGKWAVVEGGGGGGDFSTATLTYSKNGNSAAFDLKAPMVGSIEGTEMLTFTEGLTAATNLQTVTVGLYKGLAYVYIGNELDSVTGDIEADEDGYYFVTGDCAVVLSY